MPPSFRLSEAMRVVDQLQDFERVVAQGEASTARWRAEVFQHMRRQFAVIRDAAADVPADAANAAILPLIDRLTQDIAAMAQEHDVPFEQRDKVRETIAKVVATNNNKLLRYMRRQLKRIERVQSRVGDAYRNLYFEALAFRAEFDPETQPTGEVLSSPQEVEEYFKRLAAE